MLMLVKAELLQNCRKLTKIENLQIFKDKSTAGEAICEYLININICLLENKKNILGDYGISMSQCKKEIN